MSKFLLSTDIGSDPDDALALLALFNSNANLRAIYTINGDSKGRACIAKNMVRLAKKDIPIAAIAEKDETGRPFYFYEDYYVPGKCIDDDVCEKKVVYKPLRSLGIHEDAVEHAKTTLTEPHTIISIGPLTLISKLLENKSACSNIENVVVMGCNFDDGNLDHNCHHDPYAATQVFASNLPITVVPANICRKYRPQTACLDNLSTPAGNYAKRMAKGFLIAKLAQEVHHPVINGESIESLLTVHLKFKKLDCEMLIDSDFGAAEPDNYLEHYRQLINSAKNHPFKRGFGRIIA
ncbi:nucleoside hydrolase [Candidatus Woesearchaeota archaeon]|nr:nucleoside hydrolase [Candidatus Woesearchaeota archaeon]